MVCCGIERTAIGVKVEDCGNLVLSNVYDLALYLISLNPDFMSELSMHSIFKVHGASLCTGKVSQTRLLTDHGAVLLRGAGNLDFESFDEFMSDSSDSQRVHFVFGIVGSCAILL